MAFRWLFSVRRGGDRAWKEGEVTEILAKTKMAIFDHDDLWDLNGRFFGRKRRFWPFFLAIWPLCGQFLRPCLAKKFVCLPAVS